MARWKAEEFVFSKHQRMPDSQFFVKIQAPSIQAIKLSALFSWLYRKKYRDTGKRKIKLRFSGVGLFNVLVAIRFSSLVFYAKRTLTSDGNNCARLKCVRHKVTTLSVICLAFPLRITPKPALTVCSTNLVKQTDSAEICHNYDLYVLTNDTKSRYISQICIRTQTQ